MFLSCNSAFRIICIYMVICTKTCQFPYLASYKQSVQVDTSCSGTKTESSITLFVKSVMKYPVSLGNKSKFQSSPQEGLSPRDAVLSSVCIRVCLCVCVQTGIAAQFLSTISVHIELSGGLWACPSDAESLRAFVNQPRNVSSLHISFPNRLS